LIKLLRFNINLNSFSLIFPTLDFIIAFSIGLLTVMTNLSLFWCEVIQFIQQHLFLIPYPKILWMFANCRTWKCSVAKPAHFSEEAEYSVNIDSRVPTELDPVHTTRYPAPADF